MDKKACLLGLSAGLMLLGTASFADSISPDSYSATLDVGESVTITKTVTVDKGTPTSAKVDVFFLSDTTGSMGGVINTVKTNAGTILANTTGLGDVAWGVGEYKDFVKAGTSWGSFGDFPWKLNQAITTNTAAVQNGINQWGASGGNDIPESNLYGLSQAAKDDPAVGWRAGAARIIVWFGDAVGHDPVSCAAQGIAGCTNPATAGYPGPTLTQTIATLQSVNATVIGVNSGNLNGTGQATAIATATSGLYLPTFNAGTIVDEIKAAIEATFSTYNSVTLSPVGNMPGVGVSWEPLFDPAGGPWTREETRTFDFKVTFTGLEPGTHDFVIHALVDGGIVATEKDRITVPGTAVIPLPAAGWLLLGGLGALGAFARRRKAA